MDYDHILNRIDGGWRLNLAQRRAAAVVIRELIAERDMLRQELDGVLKMIGEK